MFAIPHQKKNKIKLKRIIIKKKNIYTVYIYKNRKSNKKKRTPLNPIDRSVPVLHSHGSEIKIIHSSSRVTSADAVKCKYESNHDYFTGFLPYLSFFKIK